MVKYFPIWCQNKDDPLQAKRVREVANLTDNFSNHLIFQFSKITLPETLPTLKSYILYRFVEFYFTFSMTLANWPFVIHNIHTGLYISTWYIIYSGLNINTIVWRLRTDKRWQQIVQSSCCSSEQVLQSTAQSTCCRLGLRLEKGISMYTYFKNVLKAGFIY